jgi:AraC-like DNA-binding protein
MLVRYFQPSPDLREYVRLLQLVHLQFSATDVLPFKSYWPRPENCLAFTPRDNEFIEDFDGKNRIIKPRAALIGQPTFVTNRHVGRHCLVFQVVFQTGALFRLTGIPSCEMSNQIIDAEAIFSKEINFVNERLSSTDNYNEMTLIVENFIRYLIKRKSTHSSKDLLPIDKVSQFMVGSSTYSMDILADKACLSVRQFNRKFIERTGVSPKVFSRLVRFDKAVLLKNAQPDKDWLSIALETDYYDYQHLVRDYKDFTKLTPNGFYEADTRAPERAFGVREVALF